MLGWFGRLRDQPNRFFSKGREAHRCHLPIRDELRLDRDF